MRRAPMAGLLAVALIATLAACGEDPIPTGDLQINYRIGGGGESCEDVNIDTIRVSLLTAADSEIATVVQDEDCDPAYQSVIVGGVERGSYFVRVEGLDARDNVMYYGQTSTRVEVQGDQTNGPVDVRILVLPAALEIWFDFDGPGNCDVHEVTQISVTLYRSGGSLTLEETYECEARRDEALLVEELDESQTYSLAVRGMDAEGAMTYEYNEPGISVSPGAATQILAELTSCDGVCDPP